MSDAYGPDFVTLEDEDGKELEMEILDMVEHNGILYYALYPTIPEDEETGEPDAQAEEDAGLVILKAITENGEELLSTLDSDEELEEVFAIFQDRMFEEDEDEEDE